MQKRLVIIRPRLSDDNLPPLKVSNEAWKLVCGVGHRFEANAFLTDNSFGAEQAKNIVSTLRKALDYVPTEERVPAAGRHHAMPIAPLDSAERAAVLEAIEFLEKCCRGFIIQRRSVWC